MEKGMERRDFLKAMSLAGAAAVGAGALAGCAPQGAGEKAPLASTGDIAWDEEVDVLVVGTGIAGLAAAIEAIQAGCNVKIIDKMSKYGGNTALNGGDMAAAGSEFQKEAGIEDNPEIMLADMLTAGKQYNHVDRARAVAENSVAAFEWCKSIGVEFTGKVTFHGGHSVPRTHGTINATGADFTNAAAAKVEELGGKIDLCTKLERLIEDETGRIIGAQLIDGYKIGMESSGSPYYVKTAKGIVLASGGFSNDVQMRTIHEPRLTNEFTSTNHEGATGEALREALKHKAMDVHMDWIQLGPWTSPDEPGFGSAPGFVERLVGFGLMVDPETGKRFVKETGDRKERADKMLELGRITLMVADKPNCELQVPKPYWESGRKNGVIMEYNTLDELAAAYDMPADAFKEEVERWNGFIRAGKDDDFDALIMEAATPIEVPPFYAVRLWPKVHHTMGGLVTNMQAQVIDQDYQPIPGLYAAGEICGGTHGAVRLGSVAMADCMVFGRIAGQEVAKESPAEQ